MRGRALPTGDLASSHMRERRERAGGERDGHPILDLQRSIGNRAVTLLVQRDRGNPGSGAKAGAKAVGANDTLRREVLATEAWVKYYSRRNRGVKPPNAPPVRYFPLTMFMPEAIDGRSEPIVTKGVRESRRLIADLRAERDQLKPPLSSSLAPYNMAKIALDRAAENIKPDGVLRGPATELDELRMVLEVWNRADDEIDEASAAGYQIPPTLIAVRDRAKERNEILSDRYRGGNASAARVIEAHVEQDVVDLYKDVANEVNSLRRRRAADMARAQAAEAEALEEAAEARLASLSATVAEKRRAAFAAGQPGVLKKVHSALGEVQGAVKDMKEAAGIITKQVDLLNKAATYDGGPKIINLPSLPDGVKRSIGVVDKAHKKLGLAIKLLDIVGPAKTNFDQGIKYLNGINLGVQQLAKKVPNPIFGPYVKKYLGPGIDNCIRGMGVIANILHEQNKGQIEAGQIIDVRWDVEQGGEAVYLYLRELFKVGASAGMSNAAWSFFRTHGRDLSAAVGEKMPAGQRSIGPWAYRNRKALWEAFYGSLKKPH